jgi:hypothetical protein
MRTMAPGGDALFRLDTLEGAGDSGKGDLRPFPLGLPGLLLQRGGAQRLGEVRPFGQLLEVVDLAGRRSVACSSESSSSSGWALWRWRGPRRSSHGLVDLEAAAARSS